MFALDKQLYESNSLIIWGKSHYGSLFFGLLMFLCSQVILGEIICLIFSYLELSDSIFILGEMMHLIFSYLELSDTTFIVNKGIQYWKFSNFVMCTQCTHYRLLFIIYKIIKISFHNTNDFPKIPNKIVSKIHIKSSVKLLIISFKYTYCTMAYFVMCTQCTHYRQLLMIYKIIEIFRHNIKDFSKSLKKIIDRIKTKVKLKQSYLDCCKIKKTKIYSINTHYNFSLEMIKSLTKMMSHLFGTNLSLLSLPKTLSFFYIIDKYCNNTFPGCENYMFIFTLKIKSKLLQKNFQIIPQIYHYKHLY